MCGVCVWCVCECVCVVCVCVWCGVCVVWCGVCVCGVVCVCVKSRTSILLIFPDIRSKGRRVTDCESRR